jgi:RNA polymerase sigma factor (sigma-70 family)
VDAPSDDTLMLALQAGDDAALAPLMERWELPVKAFIARLGVSAADVEDVAQEAFVRLYEKRSRFRAGAAFKPWLLTIAGNLARNRLRWRFRHPAESMDTPGGEAAEDRLASHDHGPAEASATTDLAASVRRAVDTLPQPLRAAVVCVELEDMSYHEAAGVLSCSAKAVETRLYRARQALRALLHPLLAEWRR